MKKWIPALLIIAAMAVSIYMYPSLPDRVATHFNSEGQPNGYSSRIVSAWIVPLIMAVVWVILRAAPHIDPRKQNYEKFQGAYELVVVATLAFMLVTHIAVLKSATGTRIPMERYVFVAVGALFMVLGFVLPRVRSNWFIGIRTPWTLTSTEAWDRTHRVGGPLFAGLGIISIISGLLAPHLAPWVLVAGGIGVTGFLFVYSYQIWKNDPLKHSL